MRNYAAYHVHLDRANTERINRFWRMMRAAKIHITVQYHHHSFSPRCDPNKRGTFIRVHEKPFQTQSAAFKSRVTCFIWLPCNYTCRPFFFRKDLYVGRYRPDMSRKWWGTRFDKTQKAYTHIKLNATEQETWILEKCICLKVTLNYSIAISLCSAWWAACLNSKRKLLSKLMPSLK